MAVRLLFPTFIFEVDLLKRNIFPLAHVGMQGAIVSSESGISTINVSVLFLDIVDETKEDTTDNFYGNDNYATDIEGYPQRVWLCESDLF